MKNTHLGTLIYDTMIMFLLIVIWSRDIFPTMDWFMVLTYLGGSFSMAMVKQHVVEMESKDKEEA